MRPLATGISALGADATPAWLIRTHQCSYGSYKADENSSRLKRIMHGCNWFCKDNTNPVRLNRSCKDNTNPVRLIRILQGWNGSRNADFIRFLLDWCVSCRLIQTIRCWYPAVTRLMRILQDYSTTCRTTTGPYLPLMLLFFFISTNSFKLFSFN